MIRIGSKVPDFELRTDEGTPLSLADMRGRAIVVFPVGALTPASEQVLSSLSQNAAKFLALDYSPVAVVGETAERLAAYRELSSAPFLLMSDADFALHGKLKGHEGREVGAWIVDERGLVVETVPALPDTDLVKLAYDKASKVASTAGKTN